MTETIFIRHPGIDGQPVVEIPKEGLAQYRQGGWEPLTEDEVAERERAYREERARLDAEMAHPRVLASEPEPVSDERAAEDAAMAESVVTAADAAEAQAHADREASSPSPDPEQADAPAPRKNRRSTPEETV